MSPLMLRKRVLDQRDWRKSGDRRNHQDRGRHEDRVHRGERLAEEALGVDCFIERVMLRAPVRSLPCYAPCLWLDTGRHGTGYDLIDLATASVSPCRR
jgi:hypothetical protein